MKEENIDWSLLRATESLKTIDQTDENRNEIDLRYMY